MAEKKKLEMFSPIDSRSAALAMIKDATTGFLILGVVQGGIGYFHAPELIFDGIILIVLAGLLHWFKSRIVACALMIMASIMLITTVLSFLKIAELGGRNLFMGLIVFWAAVRTVEATFKLHGRFKDRP